jgi:predicted metal-dependent peptidase
MVNIAEQLARTSKSLIFTEPFYGLFLVGLQKTFSDKIPTAGVSKSGIGVKLTINSEFFSNLSENHRKGLLKHELLHISFGHLITRDKYPDKKLFNIAADLEINQYIDASDLPEGGITMNSFPELKLDTRAGTDYYYEQLQQAQKDGKSPSLDNLLDQMDGNSQYDHSTWDDFDELPEADKKLIEKQVEHQLKEIAEQTEKRQGNIPGELSGLIERLRHVEPPKFDWRGYLKRFVGNSTVSYTKKLRRKYNKRYTENPGLKIKFKNHILVGVDTSGSVNNDELKEFMSELTHMHKTGHKITVAQCDTKINSIEEFNPKKDWEIKGRGGTFFQPVIDHFNDHGRYTALIYLTDGEASAPENCPKNTLWVLSSISDMNDDLPGRVIKLN